MNSARAGSPFAAAMDVLGLNYQGSRLPNPQYADFHQSFPDKFLFGSETASTISSRGDYTFPVADGLRRRQAAAGVGQDNATHQMSSYDLYFPSWATSPDMEFAAQDHIPFVGGEFVWTGFDYLGEPTPWGGGNDPSRSSYFGIIDLAGFPKDRFYLYQAHWRPDFPMAHLLPHWNWPDRVGQVTPVHVYTSGDEAELFLNGKSLGKKKKERFQYRIRWDDVVYEPGELQGRRLQGRQAVGHRLRQNHRRPRRSCSSSPTATPSPATAMTSPSSRSPSPTRTASWCLARRT